MDRFAETKQALALFNQVGAETYNIDVRRTNNKALGYLIPFYRLNEMDVVLHMYFMGMSDEEYRFSGDVIDECGKKYIAAFGDTELMGLFFGKN